MAQNSKQNVRFIRKNGRIIPIKAGSSGNGNSNRKAETQEKPAKQTQTIKYSAGERAKGGAFLGGVAGTIFGGVMGKGGGSIKSVAIGAAVGGALGAATLAAGNAAFGTRQEKFSYYKQKGKYYDQKPK